MNFIQEKGTSQKLGPVGGVSVCPSGRIVANHVQIRTSVKKIVPASPESNCKARVDRGVCAQWCNAIHFDRAASNALPINRAVPPVPGAAVVARGSGQCTPR